MNSGHQHENADESIKDNTAPVQVMRFTLPKDPWQLMVATVMAASLIAILLLSFLLHDAYKDIQTQVWLKQDKEEEKFQKFVAGPYAQLAGELKANEILFNVKCKESGK